MKNLCSPCAYEPSFAGDTWFPKDFFLLNTNPCRAGVTDEQTKKISRHLHFAGTYNEGHKKIINASPTRTTGLIKNRTY
ncbi:hypothetical protein NQ318_000746 [Aromia moschata]|uniref:Uncharacterized protein n=1 Tax=Aromia moschata TaxID=1265417 RepID=A0AAV8YTW5_9CUCU|nr:hypothetical protein NQ318_000746 [Aromia moschata]